MLEDFQDLVHDEVEDRRPTPNPSRGFRPKVIGDETLIVLRTRIGCCMVLGDRMFSINEFKRGAWRKPPIAMQERHAFIALGEVYDPDFHEGISSSC